MAFISATWTMSQSLIHINVDQIVSVTVISGNTAIATSVQNKNGAPYSYYVAESVEDIMGRIEVAKSFDSGR